MMALVVTMVYPLRAFAVVMVMVVRFWCSSDGDVGGALPQSNLCGAVPMSQSDPLVVSCFF
jgi:hypothetical protein